ncbi:MAG: LamG domain-containing protein [Clostridia bacterium]|nr:LamG domain-containing protein [Clostridia bacterium]
MKKLISLVAVFFLLVCSTLICSNASAAQEANLIFDLDINYTEADGLMLSNKASDNSVFGEITYGTRNSTATNGYETHSPTYSQDDLGVQYLTFAKYDTSSTADTAANRASAVKVALNTAYQGGVFANTQPISYEIWARPNSVVSSASAWGALLGVGSDTNNNSSGAYAYELRLTNGSGSYNFNQFDNCTSYNNTVVGANGASHLDRWTHYVVTREYDATNLKWIYKFYANGVLVNTIENSVTALFDYTTKSTAGAPINYLIIGNGAGSDRYRSFIGDIAAFKVYDGLLTDDYVENAYKNELGDYIKLINATSNLSEIDPDADEFSIYFDESPDLLTINDEICIKTASDEKVATKFISYDATSKTAVFSLLDYLNAGESYTLCLDDVKDSDGLPLKSSRLPFIAKAKSNALTVNSSVGTLKDANGEITEYIAQAKTVDISMDVSNNSTDDKKVVMAMIIYDQSSRLVKMIRTPDTTILAGQQNLMLEVTTAGDAEIELAEGYKIKSIAWSVEENTGAIAFSAPVELY